MKHDIESYIITIKRRGQQFDDHQTITHAASRLKPMSREHSELHDPQADYHHESVVSESLTEITAPLPGIIVDLKVKVGDTVHEGDELAVLEAMKMENSIESPHSGTVRSVNISVGESVSEGKLLITLE